MKYSNVRTKMKALTYVAYSFFALMMMGILSSDFPILQNVKLENNLWPFLGFFACGVLGMLIRYENCGAWLYFMGYSREFEDEELDAPPKMLDNCPKCGIRRK